MYELFEVLRRRLLIKFAAISIYAIAAGARAETIDFRRSSNGVWTLEVTAARLAEVFKVVNDKMGVPIITAPPPESPLTLRCSGTDVQEILSCLLGSGASVLYRRGLPGNPRAVASVRILASSYVKSPSRDSSSDAGRVTAILEMTRAEDPDMRADGYTRLAQLGKADGTFKRSVFSAGISDASGEVRAAALLGLYGVDPEGSREHVLTGLKDVDANVRLAALDVIGVGPGTEAILNQALNDPDELVRELARMRLGLPETDDNSK